MIEQARRARFLLEAAQAVRVRGVRSRQYLDREVPSQPRVPGAIHLAHPSRANSRHDFVGTELRTRQERHAAS